MNDWYEVYWNGEYADFKCYNKAMEYARHHVKGEDSPKDIAYIVRHTEHHNGIHSIQWLINDIFIVEHLV